MDGRSGEHSQGSHVVAQPSTRFDNFTGKKNCTLSSHQRNEYHKTSVKLMKEFERTDIKWKGASDIQSKLDESRRKVQRNRKILEPIVNNNNLCSTKFYWATVEIVEPVQ